MDPTAPSNAWDFTRGGGNLGANEFDTGVFYLLMWSGSRSGQTEELGPHRREGRCEAKLQGDFGYGQTTDKQWSYKGRPNKHKKVNGDVRVNLLPFTRAANTEFNAKKKSELTLANQA